MEEQLSQEWFAIRNGKFTASKIDLLLGVKGLGKTGEAYIPAAQSANLGAPKIIIPAGVQSVITLAGNTNIVPTKVYTSSTVAAIVALINA